MANMSLKKVAMPEQDPNVRNKNFDEVALGYTKEMAMGRSNPLFKLQEQTLCQRMPCQCADSGIYPESGGRRF